MLKRNLLAAVNSPASAFGNAPVESKNQENSNHKFMWEAIIIAVFSILVGVSLFFFVWRKLLPIFKQKRMLKGQLLYITLLH